MNTTGVGALHAALTSEGGAVSEALLDERELDDVEGLRGPAQLAADGPRAAGHRQELELLMEMIFEGSLLHYGTARVLRPAEEDLALLLGDQLYALGLARLAALGDLAAVTELGDLISLIAQAHARSDAGLAEAVWQAGAVAVGWGSDAAIVAAKGLARDGDPGAALALRHAAAERAGAIQSGHAPGRTDR